MGTEVPVSTLWGRRGVCDPPMFCPDNWHNPPGPATTGGRTLPSPHHRPTVLPNGNQRSDSAVRIVVNSWVWSVTPSTRSACGPWAAMRTWVPVCSCDLPGVLVE